MWNELNFYCCCSAKWLYIKFASECDNCLMVRLVAGFLGFRVHTLVSCMCAMMYVCSMLLSCFVSFDVFVICSVC